MVSSSGWRRKRRIPWQTIFTYEERLTLQKLLKEGLSFKKIAAQLHKDPSTISREVRKYAVEIATDKPGYSFNACKNRFYL